MRRGATKLQRRAGLRLGFLQPPAVAARDSRLSLSPLHPPSLLSLSLSLSLFLALPFPLQAPPGTSGKRAGGGVGEPPLTTAGAQPPLLQLSAWRHQQSHRLAAPQEAREQQAEHAGATAAAALLALEREERRHRCGTAAAGECPAASGGFSGPTYGSMHWSPPPPPSTTAPQHHRARTPRAAPQSRPNGHRGRASPAASSRVHRVHHRETQQCRYVKPRRSIPPPPKAPHVHGAAAPEEEHRHGDALAPRRRLLQVQPPLRRLLEAHERQPGQQEQEGHRGGGVGPLGLGQGDGQAGRHHGYDDHSLHPRGARRLLRRVFMPRAAFSTGSIATLDPRRRREEDLTQADGAVHRRSTLKFYSAGVKFK